MKKVLLALTLAVAGVASAQVGIYGRVGTYLDNTKLVLPPCKAWPMT